MPRKDERVSFLTEVDLEFASGKREGRISDISRGGCYVETMIPVKTGERFSFDINASDGQSVHFDGEVAYVFEGMGFGVKFLNVDENKQQFLDRLITSKS